MSIYGAMFSGVSGLKAQGNAMGMIADNISNVNTIGYKGTKNRFGTLVTTQASTTAYAPGGVASNVFREVDRQGLLQASVSTTDIAITGRGFFPVAANVDASGAIPTGTERLFTRAGSFTIDKRGYLVNAAGQFMMGVPTNASAVPTISAPRVPQLTPVNVGTLTGLATGTTQLAFGANLPSTDPVPTLTGNTIEISGALPAYSLTSQITGATNAGVITQGITIMGTSSDTNSPIRPVTVYLTFTPTANSAAGTTEYAVTVAATPPNPTGLTLTVSGTLTITNSTGAVNSSLSLSPIFAIDPLASTTKTISTVTMAPTGSTTTAGIYTGNLSGSLTKTVKTTTLAMSTKNITASTATTFASRDVSAVVYDSLGVSHTLTIRFTKVPTLTPTTGSYSGSWYAAVQDMTLVSSGTKSSLSGYPIQLGAVSFNTDGTIDTTTPSLPSSPALTMDITGATTFAPTLNFGATDTNGGLTQFSDTFAVSFVNQNGVPFGYRTGVSIDKEGIVRAVFDNGQTIPLFKMPVVTFANPNGLEPRSGNIYAQTTASGDSVLNFAGIGGAGLVSPSTLESSTVDLAEEFTTMIVTQRAYSAASKSITTADEMLDEVVRIKR